MAFLNFLLTLMVLTLIFNEPTETPGKETDVEPAYGYGDRQYESSSLPSASVSKDNAQFTAESEDIPSMYDEFIEYNQLDTAETVSAENEVFHIDEDAFTATAEQIEIDPTRTVRGDINREVANDTSVIQIEPTHFSITAALFQLATIILFIVSTAMFISIMLVLWNNSIFFLFIVYMLLYLMETRPVLVAVKYHN